MSKVEESLLSDHLTEAAGTPISTPSLPTATSLGNFPRGPKELDPCECLVLCSWVGRLIAHVVLWGTGPWAQWMGVTSEHHRLWGSIPHPCYTSGGAFRNNHLLSLISDQVSQDLQDPMTPVCGQDRGFLSYAPVTLWSLSVFFPPPPSEPDPRTQVGAPQKWPPRLVISGGVGRRLCPQLETSCPAL